MAARLMKLAEHFSIPVITMVDTPGAYPSFQSEIDGQPEALATNLLVMANLTVPIVTLFVGEGGSGGALALSMGDKIAMLSDGYYGVITPEGAASILCRYRTEAEKAKKFPEDSRKIAATQRIYPHDLLDLGVIDEIIWENHKETYQNCPDTISMIRKFIMHSLGELSQLSFSELVASRYNKFRKMGRMSKLTEEQVRSISSGLTSPPVRTQSQIIREEAAANFSKTLQHEVDSLLNFLGGVIVNGAHSVLWTPVPSELGPIKPLVPLHPELIKSGEEDTAKYILDHQGPEAVVAWLKKQSKVLITDTTMRDAHQSLLATRVRTADMLCAAEETATVLRKAFSIECFGGATFDVAIRFLHECPWKRLRMLRKKIPNICLQMLLRGANAVGYKSYPDNVIVRFIELAAKNGVDVFRIFDCFNDMSQMKLCIDTVRKVGKLAEVCICFTGDFLNPNETIYTLEYYKTMAKRIAESGAHIIAIKDMAGLFKPRMAKPFMDALRSVTDLPVHFHTHNTSHASLLAVVNMAQEGCHIVDLATASMADTTSQPSINAFLASMEGEKRAADIDWMTLERLDLLWSNIRGLYFPHESGLKSGTARVYDHQIPGGQYTNLIAQCKSLGIWQKWSDVLDMYRDVNNLLGNIIKVTPSSKVVGDFALFLINKGLTCQDVLERGETIDFPDSVVDLYQGLLGMPHHGLNQKIAQFVLKGKKPVVGRPGDSIPPADFEAERARLATFINRPVTEEDVISSLLYPKQFEDFIKYGEKNGTDILSCLPTYSFFFGMKIGGTVEIPYQTAEMEVPQTIKIVLQRVAPLGHDNKRTLVFNVDGSRREVKVKETRSADETESNTVLANPSDPSQIPSPLPGIVDKIYIKVGQSVSKGALLLSVAAMKMEVQVVAPKDGVVSKLCVQVGSKVDNKTLLLILQ